MIYSPSQNLIYAIGWTVVHALWQGALIAALTACVLRALRQKSAVARYWVANGALALLFAVSAFTFCRLWQINKPNAPTAAGLADSFMSINQFHPASRELNWTTAAENIQQTIGDHLTLIVFCWALGAAFFALRWAGGLAGTYALRSASRYTLLEEKWQARMRVFQERLGYSPVVRLAESALLQAPVALGWLKPLILFPVGAVNRLSVQEVESILAHELAHLAGRDYLVNLLQSVVEILFYYHPAVWWMGSVIRSERENRCDDCAVRLCGNPLIFAKALLAIQQAVPEKQPALAFALSLSGGRKNRLLKRVQRLFHQPNPSFNVMEKTLAVCILAFLIFAGSLSARKPWPLNRATEVKNAVAYDTFAPEKPRKLVRHQDGRKVEIDMTGDHIDSIHKDGKPVAPSEFENYRLLIAKKDEPDRFDTSSFKNVDMVVFTNDQNGNAKEIRINKEGEIIYLSFNGKVIPKEDYGKYSAQEFFESSPNTSLGNITPPKPPKPISYATAPAPAPADVIKRRNFDYHYQLDSGGNMVVNIPGSDGQKHVMKLGKRSFTIDGDTVPDDRYFEFHNSLGAEGSLKDFAKQMSDTKTFKSYAGLTPFKIRNFPLDSAFFLFSPHSDKLGNIPTLDSATYRRVKEWNEKWAKKYGPEFARRFNNERMFKDQSANLNRSAYQLKREAERLLQESDRLKKEAEKMQQDDEQQKKDVQKKKDDKH